MPVLKQGSQGAQVVSLQKQLKALGFDPGAVDGKFGPGTKKALIAFQKSKGLQADGMVGPASLAALQAAEGGSDSAGASGSKVSGGSSGAGTATGAGGAATNLNLAGLTGKTPANVIAQIPETAARFNINSNLRLAHFLAQCALESTGFTATVENLNYRADRLKAVFPKYFKNIDPAPYAHNPEKLANRVYANRMGNGVEASGDGFKFRGRGYIQLTGKNNYTSFSKFIGEDCVANPDLVATKYPLASAAFFFNSNNLWKICDKGSSDGVVTQVSTAVNGNPPHAVPERLANFKKFLKALS